MANKIKYTDLIELNPTQATLAYNNMAIILRSQGKINEAIDTFRKALKAEAEAEIKGGVERIHFSLGLLLKKTGDTAGAKYHLNKAVEGFRKSLAKKPHSIKLAVNLGDSLAEIGNFKEAAKAFQQALTLEPANPNRYITLAKALEFSGQYDEAIKVLQNGIEAMMTMGRRQIAASLQKELELVKLNKNRQQK